MTLKTWRRLRRPAAELAHVVDETEIEDETEADTDDDDASMLEQG